MEPEVPDTKPPKEEYSPLPTQINQKDNSKTPRLNTTYIMTGLTIVFILVTTIYLILGNTKSKEKTSSIDFPAATATASISPTQSLTPAASSIPNPTNTPSPSPLPSATNTPTPTPTNTPIPTPTNTPTPTPFIDTQAPTLIEMTGPPNGSTVDFSTFCFPPRYTDNNPNSHIYVQYQFDGGGWSGWSNNYVACYYNVTNGQHTFEIQAKDDAGNISTTTTRTFTVAVP